MQLLDFSFCYDLNRHGVYWDGMPGMDLATLDLSFANDAIALTGCQLSTNSLTYLSRRVDVICNAVITMSGFDGIAATVSGWLDPEQGSASLRVLHAGGWSPVAGDFSSIFTTPAFDGTLDLGVDGVALSFFANATFASPLGLVPEYPQLIALTAHADVAPRGPTISLRIEKLTLAADASFEVTLSSGLQLASDAIYAPPLLAVNGSFRRNGTMSLDLSTNETWMPVPSATALQVPPLAGSVDLDLLRGVMSASVTNSAPYGVSLAEGLAVLRGCRAAVFTTVNITAPEVPPLVATISCEAAIGGSNAFPASVSGTIDTYAGAIRLSVAHDGGWSPVTGAFAPLLTTPAFNGTLEVKVDGVFVAFVGNATYAPPLVLRRDLAVLTAYPGVAPNGPTISMHLVMLTNFSDPSFEVSLASGLQVGGPQTIDFPHLSVEGALSSAGTSDLQLTTAEPWAPVSNVPGLVVPRLEGTLRLDVPTDTLNVSLTSLTPINIALPNGLVQLRDWWLSVHTSVNLNDTFSAAAAVDEVPRIVSPIRGSLLIEPLNNLLATVSGFLDTRTASVRLRLLPVVGWSPLTGAYETRFRIPSFEGAIALNVDGVALNVTGSGILQPFVLGPNLVSISAPPDLTSSGPLIDGNLVAWNMSETPTVSIRLRALMQLGSGQHAPPPLGVDGLLDTDGVSVLNATSLSAWTPMADYPAIRVPKLTGSLQFDVLNASLVASVMNLDPLSVSIAQHAVSLSICEFDVTATVNLTDVSAAPPLTTTMQCNAVVGGSEGYPAAVSGFINTVDGSAQLQAYHSGGWSPVEGDFASLFTSPAFAGTLDIGVDGVALAAAGNATFAHSINFLAGHAVIEPGLWMRASIVQDETTDQPDIVYHIRGHVRFPTANVPACTAQGMITSSGNMSLSVSTMSPWSPVPGLISTLTVTRCYGGLWYFPSGRFWVQLTHEPLGFVRPLASLGGSAVNMLVFNRWRMQLSISAQPQAGPPNARLRASSAVRVGGALGFDANVTGTIDTSNGGSLSMVVVHPGQSWYPFPQALPSVVAPPFTGSLVYQAQGAPRLMVSADAFLQSALGLLPSGSPVQLTLTKPSTSSRVGNGPTLGVEMAQASLGAQVVWRVLFRGRVCVALQASSQSCMDVNATAVNAPLGVNVTGQYTGGDINPFQELLQPVNLGSALTVHATTQTPLLVGLFADATGLLGMTLVGRITIDLTSTGIGLTASSIRFSAIGTIGGTGGPAAAYIAEVGSVSLPTIGQVVPAGATALIGVATASSLPAVAFLGTTWQLTQGLQVLYEATTPLPGTCPNPMRFTLAVAPGTVTLSGACSGFDLRILDRAQSHPLVLPTINFISLTSLSVGGASPQPLSTNPSLPHHRPRPAWLTRSHDVWSQLQSHVMQ